MKKRFSFQAPLATIVAISSGIIMLATYFFLPMGSLRQMILEVVMIGAATALLIGVINLLNVHSQKVREGDNPTNSIALAVALVLTFAIVILQDYENIYPAFLPDSNWILANIQVPVETTLMAVLAITLTYAAARLVAQRPNLPSLVFAITLLITLAVGTQVGLETGLGQTIREFISHGLASAGARGILIGVALGTIATGLRILMGSDRPYGG